MGSKDGEEHFQINWNNNRRRTTITPSNSTAQKERKHNIVFLNAEVVKLAYSGPGFSDRTDGKHSFSEVEGVSKGDTIGLVARFRNEAIYGEDVAAVHAVRAHLRLFDRNGKEISTGFSSAQWLGHPNDTFDRDERTALDSVHSLFAIINSASKGRDRIEFTNVPVIALNEIIRPF